MKNDLKTKLNRIKLVILDVDGVLTDDTVLIGPDGVEFKRFCIADGLGIVMVKRHGIKVAWLSGRPSPATEIRARELGIEDIFQKPVNKSEFYVHLKDKYNLNDDSIAYMGNDLVDLNVMKQCGLAVTVPDSPKSLQACADYITSKRGGLGAVRELMDMLLNARGIKEENGIA